MKNIIIASFMSLAITFGGYIGVIKLTAQRHGDKKEEPVVLTKQERAAVELQLKGLEEQKSMMANLQAASSTLQSNVDIATRVLMSERKKLETIHASIAESLTASEERDGAALSKLAKLYESMKPADAAAIAAELDTDLLVDVIPRMKDRSAAKMLSAMDRQRAAEISNRLAGRAKESRR